MTPDVPPDIDSHEYEYSSSSPSRRVEPKRGEGSARGRRGGYVMVLLAMMLFGIFAMAALVIDIGFARLAQQQMQSAADTAALEGLRGAGDPGYSYEARQEAAEDFIDWIFDDDLDASNGDNGIAGTGGQFGAGPLVEFPGGAGAPELAAGQLISIYPQRTAYKPRPDMRRRLSPVTPDRFGVAIQRGGNLTDDFDLYGLGPSVPYLFARGSFIDRRLVDEGIQVGATANATYQPVVCIGEDVPQLTHPEFVEYAVSIADWLDQDTVGINEIIIPDLDLFFSNDARLVGTQVNTILPTSGSGAGYVAIFSEEANDRIIGFGSGTIEDSGTGQKIVPTSNQRAFVNVSSVFCVPVPDLDDDAADVFSQRKLFEDSLLVAPVLVN